jgi:hypothetical protein
MKTYGWLVTIKYKKGMNRNEKIKIEFGKFKFECVNPSYLSISIIVIIVIFLIIIL